MRRCSEHDRAAARDGERAARSVRIRLRRPERHTSASRRRDARRPSRRALRLAIDVIGVPQRSPSRGGRRHDRVAATERCERTDGVQRATDATRPSRGACESRRARLAPTMLRRVAARAARCAISRCGWNWRKRMSQQRGGVARAVRCAPTCQRSAAVRRRRGAACAVAARVPDESAAARSDTSLGGACANVWRQCACNDERQARRAALPIVHVGRNQLGAGRRRRARARRRRSRRS